MAWSKIISSGEVVAIHAALVPTVNGDGEIIMFGGDNHDAAAAKAGNFDHAARFNCRHPENALITVHSPAFDLFCCGHAFLGDGNLLVAGGTAEFPQDAHGIHHERHFDGHPHSAVYTAVTGSFRQVSDMTAGGRWYPTLCTVENGEVFVFQGHPAGDDQNRHGNNMMERYNSFSNRWIQLGRIGDVSVEPIEYSRLHLINSGEIFISSRVNGFTKNLLINPWSGAHGEVSPLPDGAYHNFDCPSVLLPLTPADGYNPRILLCGGTTSQFLDFRNISAGWVNVPRATNQSRIHSCATLLPTGDVLLTGGTLPVPTKENPSDQVGENGLNFSELPLIENRLSTPEGLVTGKLSKSPLKYFAIITLLLCYYQMVGFGLQAVTPSVNQANHRVQTKKQLKYIPLPTLPVPGQLLPHAHLSLTITSDFESEHQGLIPLGLLLLCAAGLRPMHLM